MLYCERGSKERVEVGWRWRGGGMLVVRAQALFVILPFKNEIVMVSYFTWSSY